MFEMAEPIIGNVLKETYGLDGLVLGVVGGGERTKKIFFRSNGC